jgi:PQQ-dependent catabolism-associated CXXCW motif protein
MNMAGRMPHRWVALALLGLASAASAAPPEPAGYWLGPPQGPVPAGITGGSVIHTDGLPELIRQARPVLVDVVPAPRRPADAVDGMPWLPPPHRAIPGTIWIPGAGWGEIASPMAAYFHDRLEDLTGHDHDRPLVFYCRPNCWMSWNAARRAIVDGYRHVYWYPDGIEGWQEAGLPTAVATPEGPEAR